MKPTKRQSGPLGRSTTLHRYRRYALCLAIAITGSVWPIRAGSIEAIFDTLCFVAPITTETASSVRVVWARAEDDI